MAENARDLILAPNEYAYISDETKGNVTVYVGPNKTSLAATDQAVIFDPETKRFKRCPLDKAIQPFIVAPEGWYIVLKNPAPDYEQPKPGTANTPGKINVGLKVNLQGPRSLALWPGQIAVAVKGHHLRSNQYLLARVYNEKAASESWGEKVLKHRDPASEVAFKADILQTGNVFVVSGNEFSFFIPPTGIEVLADNEGAYRREAVTLERLEYCILKDEAGSKRFIRGPAVVFPEPTEHFVEKEGQRKFRAFELSQQTGIYVKVTAGYTDERGVTYQPGEELFITGQETPIYFPRPEHAIIKYGARDLHYAVAIPAGEARYVLNRTSGEVHLVHGPKMYLPDPRTEVIIRRVLPIELVQLLYPGNTQALAHNAQLNNYVQEMKKSSFSKLDVSDLPVAMAAIPDSAMDQEVMTKSSKPRRGSSMGGRQALLGDTGFSPMSYSVATAGVGGGVQAFSAHGVNLADIMASAPADFGGDEFERRANQPTTAITLSGKYEGAVALTIWPGYALQTIRQDGTRKTIIGPQTVMLEYDENVHVLTFSSGTPKRDSSKIRVAYLKLHDNRVSDEIEAETADCLKVKLNVSYWINFALASSDKWFATENYVESLTDAMRVRIKEIVKKITAEQFYRDIHRIVKTEVNTAEIGVFGALGLELQNIEVNWARIEDKDITVILNGARADFIKKQFEVELRGQERDTVLALNLIQQELEVIAADTQKKHHELGTERVLREKELALLLAEKVRAEKEEDLKTRLAEQRWANQVNQEQLKGEQEKLALALGNRKNELDLDMAELKAETDAWNSRMASVSPHLVAAINNVADKGALIQIAEKMAPMTLLGGKSVVDVIQGILKGSVLEKSLDPDTALTLRK